MERAFELAEEALTAGEVTVGCVLHSAPPGVVGEGRNEVNATRNATRHAELVAVDRALHLMRRRRLDADQQRRVWTQVPSSFVSSTNTWRAV